MTILFFIYFQRPATAQRGVGHFEIGEFMISATTADITALLPLNAAMFNCFDPIDEDDSDTDLLDDKPKKPETIFDGTGYGYDTFVTPEPTKKKKAVKNKAANKIPKPLEEYTTGERRIDLLTRTYEPSGFDKEPRPQWTSPQAANDNQKRKHSFPALDEARNKTLMTGRGSAHTLIQNEWAFDILMEIHDLLDAAAPRSSWLAHNGHGAADEQESEESVNSGFGLDVVHDYGPSEEKIKKLWEHDDDLPEGETPSVPRGTSSLYTADRSQCPEDHSRPRGAAAVHY
jgi:hypothetical protein